MKQYFVKKRKLLHVRDKSLCDHRQYREFKRLEKYWFCGVAIQFILTNNINLKVAISHYPNLESKTSQFTQTYNYGHFENNLLILRRKLH